MFKNTDKKINKIKNGFIKIVYKERIETWNCVLWVYNGVRGNAR